MAKCGCSKKCFLFGIIFSGGFTLIFLILLICLIDLPLNQNNELRDIIFAETPIYDLSFQTYKPQAANKKYIESFYEFQGREKTEYDSNKKENKKVVYSKANITKIYNHYFVYKKDERTYFDYLKEYTVNSGESCKDNYKKCGIFNSKGKILCLPNEEDCPLNGFAISEFDNKNVDGTYDGYQKFTVTDFEGNNHYFYYTNTKIDEKILTTFKLSYNLPCLSSNDTSWISVFIDEREINPKCKKNKDGKSRDDRYIQVSENGITLMNLYKDNEINTFDADSNIFLSVNLYARYFLDKDEDCVNKFFSDIEEENKSFIKIEKIVRIINIISAILIMVLIIYSSIMCCCCENLQMRWILIIIYIYGIIELIVSMSIVHEGKMKYDCDEDLGFNIKINGIIEKIYSNNQSIVIAMGVLGIVSLILNLIFYLCLKLNKKIGGNMNNNIYGYTSQPPPIMYGMPQPVIAQQNPTNNMGYTTSYYKVPQINNQVVQIQPPFSNAYSPYQNNNIIMGGAPPSSSPLSNN